VDDVDRMPRPRRGMKGLRLARLPNDERDGIDAAVLVAYNQSVDPRSPPSWSLESPL
jgi:hypothetical protein